MRGQRHALAALYPWERHSTHCTGGWVRPRAGLDRCGKSRPPPGFVPPTVQPVAIRNTDYATRPSLLTVGDAKYHCTAEGWAVVAFCHPHIGLIICFGNFSFLVHNFVGSGGLNVFWVILINGRSRWPCGLRRWSDAAWLLAFRVWTPLREWMFVCCAFFV